MREHPEQVNSSNNAWNMKVSDAIKNVRTIVILQGMAGSGELGFGFIDRAYEEFTEGDSRISYFSMK